MLKIKLARFGKRGQPHYRVVVNEARDKRDGRYVEALGTYAPTQTPKTLEINTERYNFWVKQGAQPTPTVAGLFKRLSSGNPFPAKPAQPSRKKVAQAKAAQEATQTEEKAPEATAEEATA